MNDGAGQLLQSNASLENPPAPSTPLGALYMPKRPLDFDLPVPYYSDFAPCQLCGEPGPIATRDDPSRVWPSARFFCTNPACGIRIFIKRLLSPPPSVNTATDAPTRHGELLLPLGAAVAATEGPA